MLVTKPKPYTLNPETLSYKLLIVVRRTSCDFFAACTEAPTASFSIPPPSVEGLGFRA